MRQRTGVAIAVADADRASVRAFLAIPVAPPAFDEGVQLLDRLRSTLPAVRWVRGEGLHLTLHFFASLGENEVQGVLDAAAVPAVAAEPYTAQLGGLGCFPRDGDERVLWIGMLQGQRDTAALHAAVATSLAGKGFLAEERAFTPHVTLGRPRTRFDAAARRRWQGFAAETLPAFAVDEVCLYRSHPGPGGSRYEVLARLPLGARRSLSD